MFQSFGDWVTLQLWGILLLILMYLSWSYTCILLVFMILDALLTDFWEQKVFWFLLHGYLLLKIFILGIIWNCYVVPSKGQCCNANDTKILVSDYCVSASCALVNQNESSLASMPLQENFMWFLSLGECGSSIHICNKRYIELAIVICIHVLGVVLCSAWYFWNSRIYRELSRKTSFAVLSISFLLYCVFF